MTCTFEGTSPLEPKEERAIAPQAKKHVYQQHFAVLQEVKPCTTTKACQKDHQQLWRSSHYERWDFCKQNAIKNEEKRLALERAEEGSWNGLWRVFLRHNTKPRKICFSTIRIIAPKSTSDNYVAAIFLQRVFNFRHMLSINAYADGQDTSPTFLQGVGQRTKYGVDFSPRSIRFNTARVFLSSHPSDITLTSSK